MADYKDVADELDALISGNYKSDEGNEAAGDDTASNEDTDQADTTDTETETNDTTDGLDQDTDEGTAEDTEANSPVDNDGSEELDGDDEEQGTEDTEGNEPDGSTNEGSAEEDPASNEGSMGTEDTVDGTESEKTDTIDYQKQYEELLEKSGKATDFYDKIVGVKFKANGKEVEGFDDPKKIIQAMQMAYNYSEKMAGFKPYRKYMGPLKERGMLEDSSKFDLAMSLADGDTEALKQHIKNLGLDPMDLDMEDIKYTAEPKTASRDVIAIEDALDAAKANGVEDKVYNTVIKSWDDESFKTFVNDKAVQADLISQMANGDYDTIMNKVGQMSVLDDQFSEMKMVDKYKRAIVELNAAAAAEAASKQVTQGTDVEKEADSKEAEQEAAAKIAAETKAAIEAEAIAAYKAEVNRKKNEKAKLARDKANSVSKQKPKSNTRNKIDPMALNGVEVANFLDQMIMGKK